MKSNKINSILWPCHLEIIVANQYSCTNSIEKYK